MTQLGSICRGVMTALALVSFAACGGGDAAGPGIDTPTPEGFRFDLFTDVQLRLTVQDASGPMRGVAVSVEGVKTYDANSDDSSDQAVEQFTATTTDTNGEAVVTFRVPTDVEQFDVVLHQPGWSGTWTNAALRNSLGPFAPSARITRDVAEDVRVNATLTEL